MRDAIHQALGVRTGTRLPDAKQLLSMLANDARTEVRVRTAVALPDAWSTIATETMMLLRRFVSDPSPRVRAGAIRSLTEVIRVAPPVERVEIVCQWVLSQKIAERAAIAVALCSPTPVLVSDFAIEQLAQDVEPHVRALSALAAARRFAEAPRAYDDVLRRLVADPDGQVRRVASRLLKTVGKV